MEKLERTIIEMVVFCLNSKGSVPLLIAILLIPSFVVLLIVCFIYRFAKISDNKKHTVKENENDAYHRGIQKGYSEAEKDYKSKIRLLEQQVKNYADEIALSKLQKQQQHERWVNKQAVEEEKRIQQQAERKAVGTDFELSVARDLASHFKDRIAKNRTRILHTINQPGYFDTEVDVLFIDTSGIYLIECKCWRGLIVGDVNWDYWIQIGCDFANNLPVVKDGQEFLAKVFYSPVAQVSKQAQKIQGLVSERTGFSRNVYKRMAVMQSAAHLEFLKKEYNGYYKDFTWFGTKDFLFERIEQYQQQNDAILTLNQVSDIYNALRCFAHQEIFPS